MNEFFEKFYDILFAPSKVFESISYDKPYKMPLLVVLLTSSVVFLTNIKVTFTPFELLGLTGSWLSAVIYWLFFCLFVNLCAQMFNLKSNYSKLLTLSALATVPWLFLAPLKLLKAFSPLSSEIAVFFILIVWVWTVVLQVVAISRAYDIPSKNAIGIIIIPFLGFVVYTVWIFDFFLKIAQISTL
ncbi:MAG: YIP1 family protein [Candidatus Gastranaerophilales bacterium]|nr:YIP1 family protein [Candidatus Gastranaerophilales bacterium]